MLENMDVTIIFLSNDTVSPYLLFIVYEAKEKKKDLTKSIKIQFLPYHVLIL